MLTRFPQSSRMMRTIRVLSGALIMGLLLFFGAVPRIPEQRTPRTGDEPVGVVELPHVHSGRAAKTALPERHTWHPPHVAKVWMATHKGRTFRITQLPRCEHLETVIAYNPRGETLRQARSRLDGAAACTGSFHHPKTFALADFLQLRGCVFAAPKTGRWFLAARDDGKLAISQDYAKVAGKPDTSALALGQLLVPLMKDGFSTAFMNKVTDRMAIGLNGNFIFIVQGKSDIWSLAHFMQSELPCRIAINSDGGHVVRGKAPVHVVFRWKPAPKGR